MKGEYRLAVYVLATAVIEGVSIYMLYSLGYPNRPSSQWTIWFVVVANLLTLGRGSPVQEPIDPLYPVFWGAGLMFIIITLTGEALYWLYEKLKEILKTARART